MSLTVAVQMDPLEKIGIAGDSTFALMLKAQERGHRLFHYLAEDLGYEDGRVTARARPVNVPFCLGPEPAPRRDRECDPFTHLRPSVPEGSFPSGGSHGGASWLPDVRSR